MLVCFFFFATQGEEPSFQRVEKGTKYCFKLGTYNVSLPPPPPTARLLSETLQGQSPPQASVQL